MPLIAMLDGQRIESYLASDEAWDDLKRTYRTRTLEMVCGMPGVPRRSKLGLNHFAHKRGERCSLIECWSETPEHMSAKMAIAQAATDAGWVPTVEYRTEDGSWRADVLAEKDGRRIALEVQWSRQDADEFARRQERYAAGGVECFWYVHRRNEAAAEASGVPYAVFQGQGTPSNVLARLAFQELEPAPLAGHIAALLSDRYLARIEARVSSLTIEYAQDECGVCHLPSTIWRIAGAGLRTRCQQGAEFSGGASGLWPAERLETLVADDLARALEKDTPVPLSRLRMHSSKSAGLTYLAHGCAHCSPGFFGDFFMHQYDWASLKMLPTAQIPLDEKLLTQWHTCHDAGFGLCSQEPQHHNGPVFTGYPVVEDGPEPDLGPDDNHAGDEAGVAAEQVPVPTADQSPVATARPRGLCEFCGAEAHREYTCLWRRYRTLARVAAGNRHFSDDIHARIVAGELEEAEGTELLRRMFDRATANKASFGLVGSVQELEDDAAAGRPLMWYR